MDAADPITNDTPSLEPARPGRAAGIPKEVLDRLRLPARYFPCNRVRATRRITLEPVTVGGAAISADAFVVASLSSVKQDREPEVPTPMSDTRPD